MNISSIFGSKKQIKSFAEQLAEVKNIFKTSYDQAMALNAAMLDRETDIATLQDVWMSLIEHLGEYKDLGHCECCGDWISNYTLEI